MRSANPIPLRFAAVSLVFLLAITYPALSEETTTSPTVIPPDDNLINDTIPTTAATSSHSTTPSTTTTTLPTSTTPKPSTTTTVTTEVTSTSTTEKSSDLKVTRGSYNSKCSLDSDCESQFLCVSGVCHCEDPQIFDLRQEKCVIPLGRSCEPADLSHSCPQFAECFMERCVCKTGYSMHTLTRCKSDIAEVQDYKPLVLWPTSTRSSLSSSSNNVDVKVKANIKQETADEKSACNSETCDVTKGLTCQNGACKCKDVKEIFLAEFGRCLNKTMQNYLRDALNVIDESGDEIKKLVKLLEKIDQDDQQTEGSHHYSTPVHQLVGLFGEDDDDDGIDRDIPYHRHRSSHPHAQYLAPRASRRGDLHFAAQEPVSDREPALGGGSSPGDQSQSTIVAPHSSQSKAPPLLTSGGSSGNWQPSSFASSLSGGGAGSENTPIRRALALDNLEPQSQDHEPTIVERQAPHYGNNYHYPSNNYYRDPYHGYDALGGYPDGSNHLRIPIHGGPGGRGLFGLGGLGGLGHLGGLGALGHGLGLGHGLRGFGHGLGGGGGPRGPPGGGGGGGGGHGGGHGGGLGHKPGVLSEVGEVVGRLMKLIERFLPLIHAVNEVIRKEQLFKGLIGGLAGGGAKAGGGGGGGGPGGPRGRRFGEELAGSSKEELNEEQRQGGGGGGGGEEGILGGLVRFMGILMRLRERLNIPGGGALRKILEAAGSGGGDGGGS